MTTSVDVHTHWLADHDLGRLITGFVEEGRQVLGPRVVDGVIGVEPLTSVDGLPAGVSDEQGPGRYRLREADEARRFDHTVGPNSWKRHLVPPRRAVWTMTRAADGGIEVTTVDHEIEPRVLLGVRACDLAAIDVLDDVLAGGDPSAPEGHVDPDYVRRRSDVVVVAVDCGRAADTCFCASAGTGPAASSGFDIALTEVTIDGTTGYVARGGSATGEAILAELGVAEASSEQRAAAAMAVATAAGQQHRALPDTDLRPLLEARLHADHWASVAERCLACTNCTLVCPTCFCGDLVDQSDLDPDTTTRWRTWDSCFSLAYSHMGPGPERASVASRYRQWLTHKLSTWHDQFGRSGCVGCGRCITWCPVGIDLTEEVERLRREPPIGRTQPADTTPTKEEHE